MRTTDTNYNIIIQGEYSIEYYLMIGSNRIGQDKIYSIRLNRKLFNSNVVSVGGCVSAELEMRLIKPEFNIPKAEVIIPYFRIYNSTLQSNWYSLGIFHIDTRELNKQTNILSITAYDSMVLFDAPLYDYDAKAEYPKYDYEVVQLCCQKVGITFISSLDNNYLIPFMGYKKGCYTMREVLGYIASLYGGNFIIDEQGRLKLIPLIPLAGETFYLTTESGDSIQFGEDTINVG